MSPLRVTMLIPDNRDEFRQYDKPQPFFGPAPSALLEGLAQRAEIALHVISCSSVRMAAPQQLAENIAFHLLHVRHGESLRYFYAGSILAIKRKLNEIKPDLVQGQGTERYCALAAVTSGFPNLITLHGIMRGMARTTNARVGSFYWCNALLESFALKRTHGVICNSAYTETMVRVRTAAKKWRVPNALRSFFFSPAAIRPANSVPVILNIGTIEPHKRQVEVLQMARRMFESGVRFQFHFIGTVLPRDAYGVEFKRMIERAEADGFARYVQPKSDADLLSYFDAADGLLHFSREESFGLVVAEALARNLKLFATKTGGMPDIASGVEMAELFDVDDFAGLSAAITRWIDDGFPKPASAGPEMKRRYHPVVVALRHLEIYREVLASNR